MGVGKKNQFYLSHLFLSVLLNLSLRMCLWAKFVYIDPGDLFLHGIVWGFPAWTTATVRMMAVRERIFIFLPEKRGQFHFNLWLVPQSAQESLCYSQCLLSQVNSIVLHFLSFDLNCHIQSLWRLLVARSSNKPFNSASNRSSGNFPGWKKYILLKLVSFYQV